MYRLKIDMTYSNTGNANSAVSSINGVLSASGYAETATRTNTSVWLEILNIPTQEAAIALRDELNAAWSANTRTGGKVAVVRVEDP